MSRQPELVDLQRYSRHFDEKDVADFADRSALFIWGKRFRTLVGIVRDTEYRVSDSTRLTILGALAYVVFPLDLIPDAVPVLGWLDDGAVVRLVWNSAKNEIRGYALFRAKKVVFS